jgi:heme A synthase
MKIYGYAGVFRQDLCYTKMRKRPFANSSDMGGLRPGCARSRPLSRPPPRIRSWCGLQYDSMAQISAHLFRFALLVSVCSLLMVVDGALVTGAGVAGPPAGTSAGATPGSAAEPPASVGAGSAASATLPAATRAPGILELAHPWFGAVMGLLTLTLVVWVMRADARPGARGLSWALLFLLLAQGGLGSRGVMAFSPVWMGTLHACLAQLFFACAVAITVVTSPAWQRGPDLVEDYGWPSLRSFAVTTPVLLMFQVYLGAALRHKAAGALPHLGFAMFVALWILIECVCLIQQLPQHPILRPAANWLLAATCTQVFLGIGAFTMLTMEMDGTAALAAATAAHVATGALTLAICLVLSIQIRRNVMPKGSLSAASAVNPAS